MKIYIKITSILLLTTLCLSSCGSDQSVELTTFSSLNDNLENSSLEGTTPAAYQQNAVYDETSQSTSISSDDEKITEETYNEPQTEALLDQIETYSVYTQTQYSHDRYLYETFRLGYGEKLTVRIEASPKNVTEDDFVVYSNDELFISHINTIQQENENRVNIIYSISSDVPGNHVVYVFSYSDYLDATENSESEAQYHLIQIEQLDKIYGRIVFITPTGEKYHYSEECAGENAIATTFKDVDGLYEPCKKCVY